MSLCSSGTVQQDFPKLYHSVELSNCYTGDVCYQVKRATRLDSMAFQAFKQGVPEGQC